MSSTLAMRAASSSVIGGSTHMIQSHPSLSSPPINSNCYPTSPFTDTTHSAVLVPPPAAATPTTPPTPTELMPRKRPTHRRTHPGRRRECYQLLQEIIQENKRLEREEHQTMVRQAPRVIALGSPSQDLSSILVKTPAHSPISTHYPKQRGRQSVRFAADPTTKVLNCSTGSSAITKLRSFLQLFSE